MYFAYHCYLAQPIQPTQLIDFLVSLDILYMANAIQNEKALLAKFIEEGEQAPGAKTIFYILRLLSLVVSGSSHFSIHGLSLFFLFFISWVAFHQIFFDRADSVTCMKFIARRLNSFMMQGTVPPR